MVITTATTNNIMFVTSKRVGERSSRHILCPPARPFLSLFSTGLWRKTIFILSLSPIQAWPSYIQQHTHTFITYTMSLSLILLLWSMSTTQETSTERANVFSVWFVYSCYRKSLWILLLVYLTESVCGCVCICELGLREGGCVFQVFCGFSSPKCALFWLLFPCVCVNAM